MVEMALHIPSFIVGFLACIFLGFALLGFFGW